MPYYRVGDRSRFSCSFSFGPPPLKVCPPFTSFPNPAGFLLRLASKPFNDLQFPNGTTTTTRYIDIFCVIYTVPDDADEKEPGADYMNIFFAVSFLFAGGIYMRR